MALAWVFVAFLTLLNELGLGAALIQKQDVDKNTLRRIFGVLLLVCFCFFLFLVSAAPLIGSFFKEERIAPIIRLLSLQFLVMAFGIIPQSLVARKMDFKNISIVDLISAIAGSVTTLILAMSRFGVWSLAWGSIAIAVVKTVGLNFICPYIPIPSFSFKGLGQHLSFSGYVTINRVLWYFFIQADILIIGKLLGKELLGAYSVAMNLASLPMQKASGIINQVAFPAFSSIQNDSQKVASSSIKAVRILSFFVFPVLWGISSVAPELVSTLLGGKWYRATTPCQLISLVIPLRMIINVLDPAVMGLGRPDISFSIILFSSIVMPFAILIGTYWGLAGISLAWVIFFPLVFLYNLSRLVPVLGIRVFEVLEAMARPALGALIMYIIILLTRMFFATDVKSIAHLLLLIIVGALVYIGVIITIHQKGLNEVIDLLRR
jgi:O-antigen/teichoic acid export membrane protein